MTNISEIRSFHTNYGTVYIFFTIPLRFVQQSDEAKPYDALLMKRKQDEAAGKRCKRK